MRPLMRPLTRPLTRMAAHKFAPKARAWSQAALAAALAAGCASEMTVEQAQQRLAASFPNVRVERVQPSPMSGVYEVVADGSVYYLTHDGAFLLTGTLYDLTANVNLTERSKNELRSAAARRVSADDVITYAPTTGRYTVTVFSDVDCPYCRKFHAQMERVHALGIRVRYLLAPYRGQRAHRNAVAVWCSADRRAAFDRAKQGVAVAAEDCDHPVDRNLRLAETLGVRGTPAFLLENGELLNGYRTPENLLEEVKRAAAR